MNSGCKKFLSFCLAASMIVGCTSVAYAADDTTDYKSDAVLTAAGVGGTSGDKVIDVTVPTAIPMSMDKDGKVETSSSLSIQNNTEKALKVSAITVVPENGWKATSFSDDFTKKTDDGKEYAFSARNDALNPDTGKFLLSDANWGINAKASLPLNLQAKVVKQTKSATSTIAQFNFNIGFVDSKSDNGGTQTDIPDKTKTMALRLQSANPDMGVFSKQNDMTDGTSAVTTDVKYGDTVTVTPSGESYKSAVYTVKHKDTDVTESFYAKPVTCAYTYDNTSLTDAASKANSQHMALNMHKADSVSNQTVQSYTITKPVVLTANFDTRRAELTNSQADKWFTITADGVITGTTSDYDTSTDVGQNLVIPETVGGRYVKGIAKNAFMGMDAIKSITLPDNVTLHPDSVKTVNIQTGAFNKCGFTSVYIPNGYTLCTKAFDDCTHIDSAYIGDNAILAAEVFNDCNVKCVSVKSCVCKSDSPHDMYTSWGPFMHVSRIVLRAGATSIPAYLCEKSYANLEIQDPDSITSVGEFAFYFNMNVTSVSLPNVRTLGSRSFLGCPLLKKVEFPKVTSTGINTFSSCSALTSVSLPSVVVPDSGLFYSCKSLTSLTLQSATDINALFNYSSSSDLDPWQNTTDYRIKELHVPALKRLTSNIGFLTVLTNITVGSNTVIDPDAFKFNKVAPTVVRV